MRKNLVKVFGSPGWLLLLTPCMLMVVVIIKNIFVRKAPMEAYDMMLVLIPAFIMIAGMIYQLIRRSWFRACLCLFLGIVIVYAVLMGIGLSSILTDVNAKSWGWNSASARLPHGLGAVTMLWQSYDHDFDPYPETEQECKIRIDTDRQPPHEISGIGKLIEYRTNVGVYLIDIGDRHVIRLNIDDKDFLYDLTLRRVVTDVHQKGKKLGTFYKGDFIPEYAEHPNADGGLFHPCAVAVAKDGSVYAADSTARLMVKYTEDGHYQTKWRLTTEPSNGIYQSADYDITIGSEGSVWVIERGDMLKKYDPNGRLIRTFDSVDYRLSPIGTWGIAVDRKGCIYLAQSNGSAVRKVSPDGRTILEWGDATSCNFGLNPKGISITSDDRLLVANRNGGIEVYSPVGELNAKWRGFHSWFVVNYPTDVKTDEIGNVYVAAWHDSKFFIEKYTSNGRLLLKWKPPIGLTAAGPVSIATGGGFVYIADEKNHRVLKFTDNGKPIPGWGK